MEDPLYFQMSSSISVFAKPNKTLFSDERAASSKEANVTERRVPNPVSFAT